MKKLKFKSKTGFTLLEVLLAVAILVMASTMIMKGFITVMIIANNNGRYAKSGEDNYRRAMSETIARFATADDQQTGVLDELGSNSRNVVMTAAFDGSHTPYGMTPEQLNLTVDVSLYADTSAPVFSSTGDNGEYVVAGDSSALESSTVVNNRFAFFYDYSEYIDATCTSADHKNDCIVRWGYTVVDAIPDGHDASCIANPNGDGYLLYGWYCFNSNHVEGEGESAGPAACRTTPLAYGLVPPNATVPEGEGEGSET